LHENFRDCGRLTGELQRGPLLNIQNNVLVNPDYTRAIARIVAAVAPYPEAEPFYRLVQNLLRRCPSIARASRELQPIFRILD
jgi:hypothetical protein